MTSWTTRARAPVPREHQEDEVDQAHGDHGGDIGSVGAHAGDQAQQEDARAGAEGDVAIFEGARGPCQGKAPGQPASINLKATTGPRHPGVTIASLKRQ
jgi:hypothetical protein